MATEFSQSSLKERSTIRSPPTYKCEPKGTPPDPQTHQLRGLWLTKQRGVAAALWLTAPLNRNKKFQTFPNLSLNKLTTLRVADRPFIVTNGGPAVCSDRAAGLWFPVLVAMTDGLWRWWRQHSLHPQTRPRLSAPPVHRHPPWLSGPRRPHRPSYSWKVDGALTPTAVCSYKYEKDTENWVCNT